MYDDIRGPIRQGEQQTEFPPPPMPRSRLSPPRWLILATISVLVGIGIGWATMSEEAKSFWQNLPARISGGSRTYQAVFLTNGQVYFGKVKSGKADPVVLRDIFYFQVTQQLQPAPNPSESPKSVPQISLVKLGNELHGPTDEMRVTRSQVLFIENLKEDSSVVKAIKEFKR